jgi:hypothetical protein
MPSSLASVKEWVKSIPNERNRSIVEKFVSFMETTDTSENYRRGNLIVVIFFARFLGNKNISGSDTANNPNPNTRYKLVDPEDNEISLNVLIERYLSNPESCFIQRNRLDLEWLSISGSEGLGISYTRPRKV